MLELSVFYMENFYFMIIHGIFPKINEKDGFSVLIVTDNNSSEIKLADELNSIYEIGLFIEKIYKDILILSKSDEVNFPNSKNPKYYCKREKNKLEIKFGEKIIRTNIKEFLNLKRRFEYELTKFEYENLNNSAEQISEKENNSDEIEKFEFNGEIYQDKNFDIIKGNIEEIKNYNLEIYLPEKIFDNPKIFCNKITEKNKLQNYPIKILSEIIILEFLLNTEIRKNEKYSIKPGEIDKIVKLYLTYKFGFLPIINSKYYIDVDQIDKTDLIRQIMKTAEIKYLPELIFGELEPKIEVVEKIYFKDIISDLIIGENISLSELITELMDYGAALIQNKPEELEKIEHVNKYTSYILEKIPTTVETLLTLMCSV
jgi:hypothetical protein